jgi:hypothetical protein
MEVAVKVLLYPYCSMQDKRQQLFRLSSDAGVKLHLCIAGRMLAKGWEPVLALPQEYQCCDEPVLPCTTVRLPYSAELDNFARRLQWVPRWLKQIVDRFDFVLTTHETLAYPLRAFAGEKLRIVTEGGVVVADVTRELVELSWRASDLVHCNSKQLQELAEPYAQTSLWQFAYEDSIAEPRGLYRDIDVLFSSRASAAEGTSHPVFLEAARSSRWSVLVTDPTSYLRNRGELFGVPPEPLDREQYLDALHRSRVVVGLVKDGSSGWALREAMAAGACPVTLCNQDYEDLLTPEWPYYCTATAAGVREAVDDALHSGWGGVPTAVQQEVRRRLEASSYSAAWAQAEKDLEALWTL